MEVECGYCRKVINKGASEVNRAAKRGAPLFCNKVCFGLSRRLANPPTEAERKEAKRQYDARRREEKADEIKAKKAAYYAANHDREKERQYRKANMHRHVAYCQRPEYKAWKSEYDRRYRAEKQFGEFAEAFIILQEVDKEVRERATKYEIYMTNGTINKAQMRKRAL